jgi:PAS domain S-box-containing protein
MKPAKPARRHSLLKRALAANILLVGTSVMCLAALFSVTQRSALQSQLEARAGLLAEILASQSELSILMRNRLELQRTCVTALSSEDLLYVVITDASGGALAEAARPGFPLTAVPARPAVAGSAASVAIFEGARADRKFIDVARPVSTHDAQVLDWEVPKGAGASLGVVRVGFSMAKQRTLFLHTVMNALVVAVVALMLILVVHYLQLRRILKPLNDLVGFTRKVAAGDLKQRAPVAAQEEIFDLGVAFNDMVAELDLAADIGVALTEGGSLQTTLDHCARVIVRHLDVALAQIWTLREDENGIELQASAGMCPDIEGIEGRIPAGALNIARIAKHRQPYISKAVTEDPEMADQGWARRKGMVAFAGYPLIVERRLVGVAAVFDRKPLTETSLKSLASGSDQLASGIERKRAEEALRLSEERFRIAAENGSDVVWTWDMLTNQIRTSGAIERILTSPKDVPRSFDEFRRILHPEDCASVIEAIQRHLEDHKPYRQEYRIVEKNGAIRYWSARGTALRSIDGAPSEFVGVVSDITERKHTEAALSHLAAIVESSEAAIISASLDGRVLSWNAAAERIYGYSLDEARGRELSIIAPLERIGEQQDLLRKVSQGECIHHIETVRVRKGGEPISVLMTVSPLRDVAGNITGACAITSDITERKFLERQLAQAQKLESIGQLAAGIAHEINTPIQYVGDNTRFLRDAFTRLGQVFQGYGGLLGALESGADFTPLVADLQSLVKATRVHHMLAEVPQAIEDTLDGIGRVAEIVRAIKEFSHPGSSEKTLQDLNRAIASTTLVSRNEWKYVAELETNLDPNLPLVLCSPGEFNQVILNLIINAAHAIDDAVRGKPGSKGRITVSTRRDGDWAEIRVQDTGTGIPEGIRGNVFNPFFTTKEVGKGTGQGLSIAHTVVVQKHGGTITFDTEEGAGTTFIVRIPIGDGPKS